MPTSPADYDVAVLGAGPAGLAASVAAASAGARVALVDAGARAGGQYWRHRPGDAGRGQHDWARFQRFRAALETGGTDHFAGHSIWHVERTSDGFATHTTDGEANRVVESRTVVVATGAYDRQLPFPGWTLPGVFTAGGVQALLKGHGVLAGKRIAVAGTGPFLPAVAAGLLTAGADVVGVFEAGSPLNFARHPFAVARNVAKVREGARYFRTLLRHRVPYLTRATVVAAHGDGAVAGVTVAKLDSAWRVVPGTSRDLACDAVAVGYGFTPQVEIPLQLGCATRLDADGSLVTIVDDRQRGTVEGVFVAGEACGVGGAALSVTEGEIAGLYAAHATIPRQRLRHLTRRRDAQRAFAAAMHQAFPLGPQWTSWMDSETTVCRCEEVAAGEIIYAVRDLGAIDARSVKLYARPGMGLCQGRVCGFATSGLVARHAGRAVTADDLCGIAKRPIAQPLTLGALADTMEEE
ncbi:MAG TPA: FAD-dependent oxidoreductase [Amycolatopsis sp.]|uniref:FAD-dependent oxidoreductase n=1 Tax=Amycolatopsis sp. TaxID=37632 RepID=UPI002B49F075|nr:FAD-dependent oxidoreductase [Amycolatopsis sp.]HKS49644.1 FAD-dependent oxidoreductase [Amycolatopsis sp.]